MTRIRNVLAFKCSNMDLDQVKDYYIFKWVFAVIEMDH